MRDPRVDEAGVCGCREPAEAGWPRKGEEDPDEVGDGPGFCLIQTGLAQPRRERSGKTKLVVPGSARCGDVGSRRELAHRPERDPAEERGPPSSIERGRVVAVRRLLGG